VRDPAQKKRSELAGPMAGPIDAAADQNDVPQVPLTISLHMGWGLGSAALDMEMAQTIDGVVCARVCVAAKTAVCVSRCASACHDNNNA
jgi:hypothetical protein